MDVPIQQSAIYLGSPLLVQVLYDEYVTLPTTEDEWKAELKAFLEDWGFPCLGEWDFKEFFF